MDPIKFLPERLVEVGSAAGHLRERLRARYPSAQLISLEEHLSFCHATTASRWRRMFREDRIVCAAPHAIPLPTASADMVCANLSWVSADVQQRVLSECARVLRPPGLLMLASYGPQTLLELREAWRTVDQWEHTNRFADMHDVGDVLMHAGLSDVVVDSERLTVEFDDVPHLLREVRAIGGGNRAPQRRSALTTTNSLQALSAAYPDAGGYVTASVEMIFAHAWMINRPGMAVAGPVNQALS